MPIRLGCFCTTPRKGAFQYLAEVPDRENAKSSINTRRQRINYDLAIFFLVATFTLRKGRASGRVTPTASSSCLTVPVAAGVFRFDNRKFTHPERRKFPHLVNGSCLAANKRASASLDQTTRSAVEILARLNGSGLCSRCPYGSKPRLRSVGLCWRATCQG